MFPVGTKVLVFVSVSKVKVLWEKKMFNQSSLHLFFFLIYKVNTNFNLDKQFSLYNFAIFVCNEAHWRYCGLKLPINSTKDLYRDPEEENRSKMGFQ